MELKTLTVWVLPNFECRLISPNDLIPLLNCPRLVLFCKLNTSLMVPLSQKWLLSSNTTMNSNFFNARPTVEVWTLVGHVFVISYSVARRFSFVSFTKHLMSLFVSFISPLDCGDVTTVLVSAYFKMIDFIVDHGSSIFLAIYVVFLPARCLPTTRAFTSVLRCIVTRFSDTRKAPYLLWSNLGIQLFTE